MSQPVDSGISVQQLSSEPQTCALTPAMCLVAQANTTLAFLPTCSCPSSSPLLVGVVASPGQGQVLGVRLASSLYLHFREPDGS